MMKLVDMSGLGSGDNIVGVQVPLSADKFQFYFFLSKKKRRKKDYLITT